MNTHTLISNKIKLISVGFIFFMFSNNIHSQFNDTYRINEGYHLYFLAGTGYQLMLKDALRGPPGIQSNPIQFSLGFTPKSTPFHLISHYQFWRESRNSAQFIKKSNSQKIFLEMAFINKFPRRGFFPSFSVGYSSFYLNLIDRTTRIEAEDVTLEGFLLRFDYGGVEYKNHLATKFSFYTEGGFYFSNTFGNRTDLATLTIGFVINVGLGI